MKKKRVKVRIEIEEVDSGVKHSREFMDVVDGTASIEEMLDFLEKGAV